jgi:hypothetical protein
VGSTGIVYYRAELLRELYHYSNLKMLWQCTTSDECSHKSSQIPALRGFLKIVFSEAKLFQFLHGRKFRIKEEFIQARKPCSVFSLSIRKGSRRLKMFYGSSSNLGPQTHV